MNIHHKINQRALNKYHQEFIELEQEFDREASLDASGDCGRLIFEARCRAWKALNRRHTTAYLLELSFKLHDTESFGGYFPTEVWHRRNGDYGNEADWYGCPNEGDYSA